MGTQQQRKLVTEIPGPRSRELMARRAAAVSQGYGHVVPVFVAEADGATVVDVDGNAFLDFSSGIAVTTVGHAAPRVVEAVRDQVGRFTHICFNVAPYETYLRLCEELNRRTPGSHEKRSALFNSGAEAVENAVKIARRFTGRSGVVVLDHAFHGRTNLTMALTAKNMPYKDGFGPFAPEVYRVPMSYPFREPAEITGRQAADRAIAHVESQVGAANVACVLAEPIQGEGGFVVPAPGFLGRLKEWCEETGALFVADEIQSGFCRTGDWFASEHEGVVPDVVTTAKGLAGGLPLSGVTGRSDVMDAVHANGLGGTYAGNPVACAAALAAIETMEADDLCARARRIGTVLTDGLEELRHRHPGIGEVRGRGGMIAVELVQPGTRTPAPELAAAVARGCHERGLLVLTCGTNGNVLRFLPPLVIDDDQLADGLDVLAEAFAAA